MPTGEYRVVGLPGRGIVAVKSFDGTYRLGVGVDRLSRSLPARNRREFGLPTYNQMNPLEFHAVSEVDPPDRAEEFRLDLALRPGRSLTVQLVDPEGKPLTYASARGRFPVPERRPLAGLDDQSRAEITGLDPKVSRTVIFQHDERNLGATLIIKPGEAVEPDPDGDAPPLRDGDRPDRGRRRQGGPGRSRAAGGLRR